MEIYINTESNVNFSDEKSYIDLGLINYGELNYWIVD